MNKTYCTDTTHCMSIISNALLAVAAFYLIVAILIFEKCNIRKYSSKKKNKTAIFLRILCLISAVFSLLHYTVVLSSYFAADSPLKSYTFCVLWLLSYALTLMASYIFLWIRQHTINCSKRLGYRHRKTIMILSWSTLVIFCLGSLAAFIVGLKVFYYTVNLKKEELKVIRQYRNIFSGILLSSTIIAQSMLLALFIIPLVKHHYVMKAMSPKSNQHNRKSTAYGKSGNSNFMGLVKRCVIVAIACVITDVTASITTIAIQHPSAKLVYDLNLIVNVTGCVLVFANWKQKLFPCVIKAQQTSTNMFKKSLRYMNVNTSPGKLLTKTVCDHQKTCPEYLDKIGSCSSKIYGAKAQIAVLKFTATEEVDL